MLLYERELLSLSSGAIRAQNKSSEDKRTFEALPHLQSCIPLAELWAAGKIRARGFRESLPAPEALLGQAWLFAYTWGLQAECSDQSFSVCPVLPL